MTFKIAAAARIAKAEAYGTILNSGYIRIYSGVEPDVDAAITTEVLLAELTYSVTAYASGTDDGTEAQIIANVILKDDSADASGLSSFFRQYKSDGVTRVGQGNVTVVSGGGDMEIAVINIIIGQAVNATSDIHKQAKV